jgi:hypothetical protein
LSLVVAVVVVQVVAEVLVDFVQQLSNWWWRFFRNCFNLELNTNYTVTVGAGGAGSNTDGVAGTVGSNSVFSTITSTGGGGGGSYQADGTAGGSGGGGGVNDGAAQRTYGAGTANQGYNGGTPFNNSTSVNRGPGGGGGAGAVGAVMVFQQLLAQVVMV